ncbi:MAG TPA: ribulose-phosphate 3-epimerase [Planctomycetaceae bacterium]|nr:ribulose-phosphate 3-epimerase [Planctomycetaceae bacterium]
MSQHKRQDILTRLRDAAPVIAPSMLKCDFGNLKREVERLERAGAAALQFDVMDGHFVPNLTYGPAVIERLRPHAEAVFDAHLMISDPAFYLDGFLEAGCDLITFHYEAVPEPGPLLGRIREAGRAAGLAINPGTPVESIEPYLEACDVVLVMSVEPGFGGQAFIPSALDKLRRLRDRVPRTTLLSIDGGIGPETIGPCARAGARIFAVGSAIFDANDYRRAIEQLRQLAEAIA